jgi:hypothetical protein
MEALGDKAASLNLLQQAFSVWRDNYGTIRSPSIISLRQGHGPSVENLET